MRGLEYKTEGAELQQKDNGVRRSSTDEVIIMKLLQISDMNLIFTLWNLFPFSIRCSDRSTTLQQVCRERGWRIVNESQTHSYQNMNCSNWNFWWKTSAYHLPPRNYENRFHSWQIINQIPRAAVNFCKKDFLVRYIRRLKGTYKIFHYSPMSFNLPSEYMHLISEHRKRTDELDENEELNLNLKLSPNTIVNTDKKRNIWIAKPVGKSQGKGIFVFNKVWQLNYAEKCVVQEYIYRPLLIGGYKWDLRLYVCITCTRPLTIYAYREGIVRFATTKYDLNDLTNTFSHLTNSSLNKLSPTYNKQKETVGLGCKWTLEKLRDHFRRQGIRDYVLWQRIWTILILTIIGDGPEISKLKQSNNTSFQLLGFDILVDDNLKPHLLEVNVHPGLGHDTLNNVDVEVKIPMIHELFDLVGLPDGRNFFPQQKEQNSQEFIDIDPSVLYSVINRNFIRSQTKEFNSSIVASMKEYAFRLPIIKGSRNKIQIPINGPGISLSPRDWELNAPKSIGNWLLIFPFDNITISSCKFKKTKDVRLCIQQVSNYLERILKIVKPLEEKSSKGIGNEGQETDHLYDNAVKASGMFSTTHIWHPKTSNCTFKS